MAGPQGRVTATRVTRSSRRAGAGRHPSGRSTWTGRGADGAETLRGEPLGDASGVPAGEGLPEGSA
jgi:hypothetical protein